MDRDLIKRITAGEPAPVSLNSTQMLIAEVSDWANNRRAMQADTRTLDDVVRHLRALHTLLALRNES